LLIQEKLDQAVNVLNETSMDCWLTYARETIELCDPAMHFVAGRDVVWEAIFLVHRSGEKIAILGQGDHGDFEASGLYDRVLTYVQSIAEPLRDVLQELDPQNIGINYSLDSVSADGLTYGMYQRLLKHLEGTPYAERLVSAEPVFSRVRGRKTPEEIRRIEAAALETLEMFDQFAQTIGPGWTLKQISDYMHNLMAERGVGHSWTYEGDPGITTGGEMEAGHATPDDTEVQPGHALRLDFGIKKDGYSSDLQRTWYVLEPGEEDAPEEVREAFRVVRQGIDKAAATLKPGVKGWEVDAVAREVLQEHGYPEYQHALGHQVGIWAHDGGSVLGPRWERYGARPYDALEKSQVYTLEFGIQTSRGYVSQEDMVVVTENGCRFLAAPQERVWLLRF